MKNPDPIPQKSPQVECGRGGDVLSLPLNCENAERLVALDCRFKTANYLLLYKKEKV